jgi:hypothetical protein
MNKIIIIVLLNFILAKSVNAQSNRCFLICNLTTAYVCPNSNTWLNNPTLYGDVEIMQSLGYKKDKKGCWSLKGNKKVEIRKPLDKLKELYEKLKNEFSVTKTGF